jgi:glucan endo-1,3-beta-D-glucosidase
MPASSSLLALATAVTSASAAFQGFNYDSKGKAQADFERDFKTAANLAGTDGAFTSARLYTMIQDGTPNEPISAIPAAISTKTSLLFGLWASAGQEAFNQEVAALKKTIDQYCGQLDELVAGISVGSEDLYRETPTSKLTSPDPGAGPETLVGYIDEVREAIKGSCLQDVPVGHVDTWTAYVNETNKPLIDACDWLGMDAYPYFENTKPNSIENGNDLLQDALDKTAAAAGGKPIWITETGWPVSGKTENEAETSNENAEHFWKHAGCPRFGEMNVWWYILQDATAPPAPNFAVADANGKPLFDLSCDNVEKETSSAMTSMVQTKTSEAPQSTMPGQESTTRAGNPDTTLPQTSDETAPTTMMTASQSQQPPVQTSDNDNDNDSGAGGQPTGDDNNSGSQTTGNQGGSQPTTTPIQGAASGLNAFGAAVAAMAVAAAAL